MGWRLDIEGSGARESGLRFFQSKATTIVATTPIIVTFVLVLWWAWQKWTTPARPGDYEGRIVDRWVDNSGAAEGYQPSLALLIESADGKRFTVKVDPNVYESARVGMRIRSKSGQVVLIESPRESIGK